MPSAPRRKGKATKIAENILGLRKNNRHSDSQNNVLSKEPSVEERNKKRLQIPSY